MSDRQMIMMIRCDDYSNVHRIHLLYWTAFILIRLRLRPRTRTRPRPRPRTRPRPRPSPRPRLRIERSLRLPIHSVVVPVVKFFYIINVLSYSNFLVIHHLVIHSSLRLLFLVYQSSSIKKYIRCAIFRGHCDIYEAISNLELLV